MISSPIERVEAVLGGIRKLEAPSGAGRYAIWLRRVRRVPVQHCFSTLSARWPHSTIFRPTSAPSCRWCSGAAAATTRSPRCCRIDRAGVRQRALDGARCARPGHARACRAPRADHRLPARSALRARAAMRPAISWPLAERARLGARGGFGARSRWRTARCPRSRRPPTRRRRPARAARRARPRRRSARAADAAASRRRAASRAPRVRRTARS